MSSIPTRWVLPTPATHDVRARLNWLHPVVLQVLFTRGLTEPDQVAEYYGLRVPADDPFRMMGIPEAVERLEQAISRDEAIVVYGDFDADGVTSTALMVQILSALGARVRHYIPHRVDEGYGLNKEALRHLCAEGARVVLTVDCGIRSIDEVREGVALGMDMIVSDHHAAGRELPPALAVINPRQNGCPYPYQGFAGVGVAFKLAQALLRSGGEPPLAEDDLLDLVALGTIADLMSLQGENRLLVRRGLEVLNRGLRPGVLALARVAGTPMGKIDATAVGYRLAPRLNAAGRLHTALLAYDLLSTSDEAQAETLALELERLNRERQRLTEEAVQWAQTELGDSPPDYVILVGREHLNPGIVGLVASRLKDLYGRPALVVELGGETVRGSARSVPEFGITEALDLCDPAWFVRYGGHKAAAGFTIHRQYLPALRQALNEQAEARLPDLDSRERKLPIDAIISLRDVDYALLGKLRELEPTGADNAAPVLAVPNLWVRESRRVGSDGSHLKLRLTDGFQSIDAIGFGLGGLAGHLPQRVDAAGALEENTWQGIRSLQLVLQDVKPVGRGVPLS